MPLDERTTSMNKILGKKGDYEIMLSIDYDNIKHLAEIFGAG